MPVHPEYQVLLDMMAEASAGAPPWSDITPEMARAQFSAMGEPGPEVASVHEKEVPAGSGTIPVRIYRPIATGDAPVGALIYFHGGGWVVGSLDSHDPICRELCQGAGIVVFSVDYRLAPEHGFPAAVEDSWEVTRWVAAEAEGLGVDPSRIAVGGDSAGGNLAAVVALLAREHGRPDLAFQLLICPVVDTQPERWPSYRANGEGYLLTADLMSWFFDHYVSPGLRQDWRVAPLAASSHGDLPAALVITAEFDPLRDEGSAYASALAAAGVAVTHIDVEGGIHALTQFPSTALGRRAIEDSVAALRHALA